MKTRPQILPILQPGYFFARGMCPYLLRSSLSVGLRLAKTTEVCAKITEICDKITGVCAKITEARGFLYRSLYAAFLPLPSSLALCYQASRGCPCKKGGKDW